MILSGFGLYLCYACFHTMFFERWIALFRYSSNIGFLICVSDSFGYLGSVGVLVYKNFFNYDVDWLAFIKIAAYVSGVVITLLSVGMFFYFRHKEKNVALERTQPANMEADYFKSKEQQLAAC